MIRLVSSARLAQLLIAFVFLLGHGIPEGGLGVLGINEAAAQVEYLYDESGRLTGVIAPNGEAAQYIYDGAGNITGVARVASGAVSIIEVSPDSGPVGTAVTVSGTGFSSTPSQNTVQFNGTSATVSAASPTKLTVTVPAGATTGAVAVTSPSGSATSPTAFTVTASSGQPTVSGFTPGIGVVGDPVTITGTNFQPIPANNRVRFNVEPAALTSASSTQIQANVPNNATSGPISVATSYGTATSADDFFVVPPGKVVADVAFTGRIAVNGADLSVPISTAQKLGLVVFTGTQGQRLRLIVSPTTFTNATISVYTPTGVQLTSKLVPSPGDTVVIPFLPVTGTYTIRITPGGSYTGSMTLSLRSALTLMVDGSSLGDTLAKVGEEGIYTFDGSPGQLLGLGISAFSSTPSGGSANYFVYNPDGSQLISCGGASAPAAECDLPALPATGAYTVLVDPNGSNAVGFTLTLSNDATGALTPNGSALNFATSRVGQNARYTFTGTAGQYFSLLWTGSTFPGNNYLRVYKPDGGQLTYANFNNTSTANGYLDLPVLPDSGTYTVLISPFKDSTGQIDIALRQDDNGTLTIDGATLSIDLAAGQNGRYTFSGTAGQTLGLGTSSLSTTPAGGTVTPIVYKPDGTSLIQCTAPSAPGGECNLSALPDTGTYTLFINPYSTYAESMTLTLSNDVSGTLTPNGSALNFATTRVGQNARYTFTGTAGQYFSLLWTGGTFPGTNTIYVYKPNGSQLASANFNNTSTANGFLDLPVLPDSGTYTVLVNPYKDSTGHVDIALRQDDNGTLTIDGDTLSISLAAGQNGRYTFSGTAGQTLGLGISSLSTTPAGGTVTPIVYKPDGTSLIQCTAPSAPGGECNLPALPATGTYTLFINPASTYAEGMTLTLSSDITGTLTPNGGNSVFSTTRVGQNARYTFSGTASQAYTLHWSGATFAGNYSRFYVYRPNGTQLTSTNFNGAGSSSGSLNLGSLATTGTYTIVVNPYGSSTGQVTVWLTSP